MSNCISYGSSYNTPIENYLTLMADVSSDIIKKLWYATEDSTWSSLISGLNEIEAYDEINLDQYQDLKYAIDKLAEMNYDFPDSPGELHQLLDHNM